MDQENVSQVGEVIVSLVESQIDPPSDQLLYQEAISRFDLEALLILKRQHLIMQVCIM